MDFYYFYFTVTILRRTCNYILLFKGTQYLSFAQCNYKSSALQWGKVMLCGGVCFAIWVYCTAGGALSGSGTSASSQQPG